MLLSPSQKPVRPVLLGSPGENPVCWSVRIPPYWIVDLKHRRVEVHTQAAGNGKQALYGRCDIYLDNDLVPLTLDGTEVGKIAVAALLPDAAVLP